MCPPCLEEKHAAVIYGLHIGDFKFRYVGQTRQSLKARMHGHRTKARGDEHKSPLYSWMRKHGIENIQVCIIETFTDEDIDQLDEREMFHIAQARYLYPGNLNLSDGGASNNGLKASDETRAKMSAAHMGRQYSLGVRPSEETRAKLSAARMGNKYRLGIPHTEETKAKMRAAHVGREPRRGYTLSPEHVEKVRQANLGRVYSEESLANMKAARLASKTFGRGSHVRWHVSRDIVKDDCKFCIAEG